MDPITIISQSVTAGGLTGARPALTLFLLQLYGLFLAKPTLPEGTEWLLNEYVVGVCGALVVVEHFVRTEPDFEEVMKIPNQVLGVVVAVGGALLLAGLGEDPERWKEVSQRALIWTAGGGGEGAMGTLTVSMVLAAGSSLGLGWVRRRLMEALGALSLPSRWWRWIEAGGVTGVVAMVVLLPVLALVLALALALVTGATAGLVWWVQRIRDQRSRRDCPNPSCSARPRVEASVCPACKTALRPAEPDAMQPATAS
jgi:hypothetical protein